MPAAIPFNKPYFSGLETKYIEEAVRAGKISGDGMFTKRCHAFFEQELGFHPTTEGQSSGRADSDRAIPAGGAR